MNTTTLDMITVNGIERPRQFTRLSEWENWYTTHARPVVSRESIVRQAKELAGREQNVHVLGDLQTADAMDRYIRRVQELVGEMTHHVAERNADAERFNATLALSKDDIDGITFESQHGATVRAQAELNSTPLY